jgi:hypothetical protein
LSVPYLPSPKQAEALAMPGHNRFGLDEHQRRAANDARCGIARPRGGDPLT